MSIANTPSGSTNENAGETEADGSNQDVTWLDGILLDEKEGEAQPSGWADPLEVDSSSTSQGSSKQGWLQKTFGISTRSDENVENLRNQISALQQQVKILSARASIYELDDSELLAVAGEDAAIMVRAAKAKTVALLAEAEVRVNQLRNMSQQEFAATKERSKQLVASAKDEADEIVKQAQERAANALTHAENEAKALSDQAKREHARLLSEGELRLSEVRVEVERLQQETQERSAEWLKRSRAEAQAEAESVLKDAYSERLNVIERLKIQSERARSLAQETNMVQKNFVDFAQRLEESLKVALTNLDQIRTGSDGIVTQSEVAEKNS